MVLQLYVHFLLLTLKTSIRRYNNTSNIVICGFSYCLAECKLLGSRGFSKNITFQKTKVVVVTSKIREK